jgi:hypothetical protein
MLPKCCCLHLMAALRQSWRPCENKDVHPERLGPLTRFQARFLARWGVRALVARICQVSCVKHFETYKTYNSITLTC